MRGSLRVFPGAAPRILLTASALALLPLTSVDAQEVRGTAAEVGDGLAIRGAFVSLLDVTGASVDSDLSGPDGSFAVKGARSGEYRLQVERIGYESWTSESLAMRSRRSGDGFRGCGSRTACRRRDVRPTAGI